MCVCTRARERGQEIEPARERETHIHIYRAIEGGRRGVGGEREGGGMRGVFVRVQEKASACTRV